jgi:hypothetical protein
LAFADGEVNMTLLAIPDSIVGFVGYSPAFPDPSPFLEPFFQTQDRAGA